MKITHFVRSFGLMGVILITVSADAQKNRIRDLDFLIGTWEVREDNLEKNWWEKTTRVCQYVLDSTCIELKSSSITSDGKKRSYHWHIHYNEKAGQFEMVSMFSNWHKIQFDVLDWLPKERKIIIRNGQDFGADEYHERYGEIVFYQDYQSYEWKGENKYGDRANPGIWRYTEVGKKKQD